MKTIEEILQQYFNCPTPFNEFGDMTEEGWAAYHKLDQLLFDIDILCGEHFHQIYSRELDEIIDEKY